MPVVVHADDLFSVVRLVALSELEASVWAAFEGKVEGGLRAPGDECRILNRVVRRTEASYEWEAGQLHAELIVAPAGLDGDSRELT